jgi:hypothetical protein
MAQTEFSTGTIAAYFENSSDARKAVDALQKAGFTSAHLGIAHHGSYTGESSTFGNTTVYETEDKEPSTWDKIKAWFSGNSAEARSEERASEPGDKGYDDISDLRGSFTAMNIPQDRARYFAHRFAHGKDAAIVTIEAGDRAREAESILSQYNADLGESASTYEYTVEDESLTDDLREESRTNTPSNVQLLGVLRVQTVRVIPDDQPFGRKEPASDLPGNINRTDIAEEERKRRERSA